MNPELHSQTILIRVTQQMKAQLLALSAETGAPLSYLVRRYVQSGIDSVAATK